MISSFVALTEWVWSFNGLGFFLMFFLVFGLLAFASLVLLTTVVALCVPPRGKQVSVTPEGDPVRRFHPRLFWSLQNNPLSGVTLGAWLRILWRLGGAVQWRTYWVRAAFVTCMSCFNSCLGAVETLLNGRAIANTKILPRPVFIIGHPRTGTTHLHNLLSLDPRFAFPNTFSVGFPSCFLWFEAIGKHLLSGVLSETRPMDNMALSMDTPQEDELATNVLSAGTSYYMPIFFMQQHKDFLPFLTLQDKHRCSTEARRTWTEAFQYMLKKLSLRAIRQGRPRARLLLKSPVHTARIPLLLDLFPDAQFVFIHRHPFRVFQSAANMADTTYWYSYLNVPDDTHVQGFVTTQFEHMMRAYKEGRELIPKGNLIELSFDELTQQPVETLARVYKELKWESFDPLRPVLDNYLRSLKSYRKNKFTSAQPELRAMIARRWKWAFTEFGYPLPALEHNEEKEEQTVENGKEKATVRARVQRVQRID